MPANPVSKIIAFQIKLALTSRNIADHDLQNQDAKAWGLTGAEVDAARSGRSFDIQTDAAVRLACALQSGDICAIERQRNLAKLAGLDAGFCEEIRRLTLQISS